MSFATDGRWSGDQPAPGDSHAIGDGEGVFVIHATLMVNGKVLWFSGHTEQAHYLAESWVWDPALPIATATRQPFPASTDVFCCHHANLEDGRVITVGGARAHPNHGEGIRAICIFDPATSAWSHIGDMHEARWYPTLVTLPDGRLVAFSGRRAAGESTFIAETVEVFSPPFRGPGYTTATVTGGTKVFPTYPGLHLVRGGRIVHTGPTWRYERNATTPIGTWSLRMTAGASGAWTDEAVSPQVDFREEGMSVLLPPAQAGRILLLGGGKAHFDGGGNFTSLDPASQPRSAEILDTATNPPTWTRIADMNQPRINGSAVLLPNGTVLVLGGHNRFKFDGGATPSLPAEIYDPAANVWRSAGTMAVPRMYHSAHLLLPDGRVICAGGADPNLGGDDNRKSFEIYEPPYFFNPDDTLAARPQITGTSRDDGPDDVLAYGREFFIQTPNAASIARVALMRPGAMTHHTDSEQRYVAVDFFAEPGAGRLRAMAPTDATIAPPGFYMLWIVDTNGRPCQRARFVRLSRAQFYVITDRSTFSKDEVAPGLATTTFEHAFYVVMEGFAPEELGINGATPFMPPPSVVTPTIAFDAAGTPIPQISAVVRELLVEIPSVPTGVRQRFVLRYAVEIRGHAPFFQPNGTTPIENREIRMRVTRGEHAGLGSIRLTHQPNPYTLDGPKPWLSLDLRVFKVLDGDTRFGQPPLNPTAGGAIDFIQGTLARLRTVGSARAEFEALPTEAEPSQLDIAEARDGRRVYNFALCQVRYRGRTLDAHDVRVFFRLFTTAATGMEFRPETYATVPNVDGKPIPVLGSQGGHLATIPFFAEPRVNPGDPLTLQRDPFNTQTLLHNPSGAESTWYFGCWLDFNQSSPGRFPLNGGGAGPFFGPLASIQQLVRGRHQCLVAELLFPPDPTPLNATPGNNDNLAQRNLAILETDNPGGPATRTVQHTFEIKPSPNVTVGAPATKALAFEGVERVARRGFIVERPDELMFRWGNLPPGTEVTIYLPDVRVEDILELAMARHTWGQLEMVDAHTLRCVAQGGVTFVPLPGNRTATIPGLIEMVLPMGIRSGNKYKVTVHQASGQRRAIIGAFEIAIHVSKAHLLLGEEKRTLSVMRYIALAIPPGDRWYPIFQRYLKHFADRVHGFGGNPDRIEPSPSGDGPEGDDRDPCACRCRCGCRDDHGHHDGHGHHGHLDRRKQAGVALLAFVGLASAVWLTRRRC
jgi:hypothetical protein